MEKHQGVIVITGASGTLGTAIIDALAPYFHIVGFDRPGPPYPPKMADCVPFDITSDESVRNALRSVRDRYGERIAAVIHLAAYYDFTGEPNPLYRAINVQGTERLLRGLQDFQVEQFIDAGTMLVYAPTVPGIPMAEDWPLDPKWVYPQSKLAAEKILRTQHGDIPIVLLRIAGVYTDRCQVTTLAHQIQRIHERTLISHVFPGDLSHGQSFVHLEDLAAAFMPLVERRASLPAELVLNIGEACTLSYAALQNAIGHLLYGIPWETREIPKAVAKTGVWLEEWVPNEKPFIKSFMIDLADDHFELDITRAETVLNWHPAHSLRETLPIMIEALKRDPTSWYRENHLDATALATAGSEQPDTAPKSAEERKNG